MAEKQRVSAVVSDLPAKPVKRRKPALPRLRQGLYTDQELVAGESPVEFKALKAATHDDLQPVGTVETVLVERIAMTIWRQRRLARAEWAQAERAILPSRVSCQVKQMDDDRLDKTTGQPRRYPDWQQETARAILAELDTIEADGWLPGADGWLHNDRDRVPYLARYIVDTVDPSQYGGDYELVLQDWVDVHHDGHWSDYLAQIRVEMQFILGDPAAQERLDHLVDIALGSAMLPEIESQRLVDYQTKLDRQMSKLLGDLERQQQRRRERDKTIVSNR